MQGDRRALEDQLSHKHHRPEAGHVQVVLAAAQHVPRRLALDHRGVHSRALPGRQLSAPLEHDLEAHARQALHRPHSIHVRAGVAVRAPTQRRAPPAQFLVQEVHQEAQERAESRPVDAFSTGQVL